MDNKERFYRVNRATAVEICKGRSTQFKVIGEPIVITVDKYEDKDFSGMYKACISSPLERKDIYVKKAYETLENGKKVFSGFIETEPGKQK